MQKGSYKCWCYCSEHLPCLVWCLHRGLTWPFSYQNSQILLSCAKLLHTGPPANTVQKKMHDQIFLVLASMYFWYKMDIKLWKLIIFLLKFIHQCQIFMAFLKLQKMTLFRQKKTSNSLSTNSLKMFVHDFLVKKKCFLHFFP